MNTFKRRYSIRSVILTKMDLSIFFEPNFNTKDLTVIQCTDNKSNRKSILTVPAYMDINEEIVVLSAEVIRLAKLATLM